MRVSHNQRSRPGFPGPEACLTAGVAGWTPGLDSTHLRNPHPTSAGLTLIELLVVLAILAVTASVALRTTGPVLDQTRYDRSKVVMESVRDAILGPKNLRQVDDRGAAAGFVADLGRLPGAWLSVVDGTNALTLNELVYQRSGVPAFAYYPATAGNLTAATATNADPDVVVPAGWRGPYLKLPYGQETIRDGWKGIIGNLFPTSLDPYPALFTFPTGPNPAVPSAPIPTLAYAVNDRDPIAGVAIRSPSFRNDPLLGIPVQDVLTNLMDASEVQCSLSIYVRVANATTPVNNVVNSVLTNTFIVARLYGPNAGASNPGDPPIDSVVAVVAGGATINTNNPVLIQFTNSAVAGVLTPGPRMLRLFTGRKNTNSPPFWSGVYTLSLRAGDNLTTNEVVVLAN